MKSREQIIDEILNTANGSWKDIAEEAFDEGVKYASPAIVGMEWVDVKDRLPEDKQDVSIWTSDAPKALVSTYDKGRNLFYRYANGIDGDRMSHYYFSNVTHWQSLPPAPKDNQYGNP